jgi:hypothetical protein
VRILPVAKVTKAPEAAALKDVRFDALLLYAAGAWLDEINALAEALLEEAHPDGLATGAGVFRYGDVYGNPILQKAWEELPEGYCRAYQGVPCDEVPLGRDFFGGDLAGITAKLDDLADLGVTVLYLNPVFAAPSLNCCDRYCRTDAPALPRR